MSLNHYVLLITKLLSKARQEDTLVYDNICNLIKIVKSNEKLMYDKLLSNQINSDVDLDKIQKDKEFNLLILAYKKEIIDRNDIDITLMTKNLIFNKDNITQLTRIIFFAEEFITSQEEAPIYLTELINLSLISTKNNIEINIRAIESLVFLLKVDSNSDGIVSKQNYLNKINFLDSILHNIWNLLGLNAKLNNEIAALLCEIYTIKEDIINFICGEINNNQLSSTKKVILLWNYIYLNNEDPQKYNMFTNGRILLKIIELLDSSNPLLKNDIKNWIYNSFDKIDVMLNPILIFLLSQRFYLTEKNELFIYNQYDNRIIQESFNKLKLILNTLNDIIANSNGNSLISSLIKMTVSKELSCLNDLSIIKINSTTDLLDKEDKKIMSIVNNSFGVTEVITNHTKSNLSKHMDNDKNKPRECNYFELIITLSMRFIRADYFKYAEGLVYDDVLIVKSISVDFLHTILQFVENINILLQLSALYSEPLISLLNNALLQNDIISISNVISLLNSLIIHPMNIYIGIQNNSDKNKKTVDIISNNLKTQLFQDALILSLKYYEIDYITKFLEQLLPLVKTIYSSQLYSSLGNKLLLSSLSLINEKTIISKCNDELDQKLSSKIKEASKIYNTLIRDNKVFVIRNFNFSSSNSTINLDNRIINTLRIIIYSFYNIIIPTVITSTSIESLKINSNDKPSHSIILKEINFQSLRKKLENQSKETESNLIDDYESILLHHNTKLVSHIKKTIKLYFSIDKNSISREVLICMKDIINTLVIIYDNNSNFYLKDICLSEYGIIKYSEEEIKYLLYTNIYRIDQSSKTNDIVINTLLNLFISFPISYINCFISIWSNNNIPNGKLKLIEILLSSGVSFEFILFTINNVIPIVKAKDFKKAKIKTSDGNYPFTIDKNKLTNESNLSLMYYSLMTLYAEGHFNNQIIHEIIKFINSMIETINPSTFIFLFEILSLLIIKSGSSSLSEKGINKQLIGIFTILYNKIVDFAFQQENKVNKTLNSIVFTVDNNPYYSNVNIILPLPPTFYTLLTNTIFNGKAFCYLKSNQSEVYISNSYQKKNKKDEDIYLYNNTHYSYKSDKYLFLMKVFESIVNNTLLSSEEFNSLYKFIAIMTFNDNIISILKQIYTSEKSDRLNHIISSIVKQAIILLRTSFNNKTIQSQSLFYSKSNSLMVELTIDLLHSFVLSLGAITVSVCKKELNDLYQDNIFFSLISTSSPSKWKEIINTYSFYNETLIDELLSSINTQSSFFSKMSDKQIIKGIRLLLLSIFYSNNNSYTHKINLILEKIKEMIVIYSGNSLIETEIILAIRVLLIKFNNDTLIDLLKHFWPILFNFLITLLKSYERSHANLIYSCFKLLECLNLICNDEFGFYEWVFLNERQDKEGNYIDDFKPLLCNLIQTLEFNKDVITEIPNNIVNTSSLTCNLVSSNSWEVVLKSAKELNLVRIYDKESKLKEIESLIELEILNTS